MDAYDAWLASSLAEWVRISPNRASVAAFFPQVVSGTRLACNTSVCVPRHSLGLDGEAVIATVHRQATACGWRPTGVTEALWFGSGSRREVQ